MLCRFIEYPALGSADKSKCVASSVKTALNESNLYQHIVIICCLDGYDSLPRMGAEQTGRVHGSKYIRYVCIRKSVDGKYRFNVRVVVF